MNMDFKQLIDLAIGSPEPGHVNFYALHFLLYSFAEKLNIINEPVDSSRYDLISFGTQTCKIYKKPFILKSRRLFAGANPTEQENEESEHVGVGGEPEPEATVFEGDMAPEEGDDEDPGEEQQELYEAEEVPPPKTRVTSTPRAVPPPSHFPTETTTTVERKSMERGSYSSVELEVKGNKVAEEVYRGVAIMKDQLELAMELVRMLVDITVNKRSGSAKMERLRSICKKMASIQKENVFIDNAFGFRISLDGIEIPDEAVEEETEEVMPEESIHSNPSYRSDLAPITTEQEQQQEQYDLDLHLIYTPEKLLDQLLELKSEFCTLTNKVNEISASLLDQDCQRTMMIIHDLQEQMKEVKASTNNFKETQERLDMKVIRDNERVDALVRGLDELQAEKIDRSEIEILLADKVDYSQLQRKVSQEQIQEMQCRLEKQFCEMHKIINLNEKNMYAVMENMRTTLGLASVDEVLRRFKEKIEGDIHTLQDTLRSYIEATNDECAAAGARIKVLQDLACLSCDTTCVMRTIERSKVAKMPNAHATNILSPLITYELGSIRKSGIMGYYRKDEFPHAPNAWMQRQGAAMKMCVPRHAGGPHTTYTAKDHVEKVLTKKQ